MRKKKLLKQGLRGQSKLLRHAAPALPDSALPNRLSPHRSNTDIEVRPDGNADSRLLAARPPEGVVSKRKRARYRSGKCDPRHQR